jgi:hypothetical protein
VKPAADDDRWWFYGPDGRRYPIIAGGSGEKEGEEEEDDDSEEEDGEEEEEGEEEVVRDPKAKLKSQADHISRLHKKISRSDKEMEKKDARIKELEDAGKSDQQKLVDERDNALKEVEQLRSTVAEQQIKIVALTRDDIAKLDEGSREVVLDWVMNRLEVDDDGDNFEELISQLKEKSPSLFANNDNGSSSEEDQEEEGQQQEEDKPRKKPPARTPGQRKKTPGIDRTMMMRRFPALRGRVTDTKSETG